MLENHQNLTFISLTVKSDYRLVKLSLTAGLGSYPESEHKFATQQIQMNGPLPRKKLHMWYSKYPNKTGKVGITD